MYVSGTDGWQQTAAPTYDTAQVGKQEFLQLLVTQLRLQDPLEPVKEQDFIAQLAQFSTLEGVNNLAVQLETISELTELMLWQSSNREATDMLGRKVRLATSDGDITGTVTGVRWHDARPSVVVDGQAYDLGFVREIYLDLSAPEGQTAPLADEGLETDVNLKIDGKDEGVGDD